MSERVHTVERAVLQAALICAGDVWRPEVNGVWFDKGGFVVSTDGHRLFVGRLTKDSAWPSKGFLVPVEAIKFAVAMHEPVLHVQMGEIDGVSFKPTFGFPDWRKVVPEKCSGVVGQFDGKYLGDWGRIGKLLTGCTQFHIHHNGTEGGAVIQFPDDHKGYFGVQMPFCSIIDGWRRPKDFNRKTKAKQETVSV